MTTSEKNAGTYKNENVAKGVRFKRRCKTIWPFFTIVVFTFLFLSQD